MSTKLNAAELGGIDPCIDEIEPTNGLVELIAGPFAPAVRLIWSESRLTEFLSATDTRRQVWYAWLTKTSRAALSANSSSAVLTYRHLSGLRAVDLLAQSHGSCPNGFVKALGRLGPQARDPIVYAALHSILARGGAGEKYVRHCKTLSDTEILGLSVLPTTARSAAALTLFKDSSVGPEKVGFFAWASSRLEVLHSADEADAVFQSPKPWDELWQTIFRCEFPCPPWVTQGLLRPLTSLAEFRDAARRFRNCLRTTEAEARELTQVVSGQAYFYEWIGDEPALLRFQSLGRLGWHAGEIRGLNNTSISRATKDAIGRELSGHPEVFCGWDPGFSCYWDRPYYWDDAA